MGCHLFYWTLRRMFFVEFLFICYTRYVLYEYHVSRIYILYGTYVKQTFSLATGGSQKYLNLSENLE